jgi:putative PEP-CTERM system TPR-repeat lipoprotein
MTFGKGLSIITLLAALGLGACSSSSTDAMLQGKTYVAKGDLPAAVIAFRNAVQGDPTAVAARLALGDALERTGELTGAEQHYRRALELGGDAGYLVPKIAVILLDRSDLITLVRDFGGKQLKAPAANSDLRGILAVTHLTLGEKSKALAELSRVSVETPAVRLARAQLALGEGRNEDASSELERVLKDANPPWWVLRAAARVYWARGEVDKALSTMKAAYAAAGAHPDVMGEYAEKLLRSGHTEDAKQLLGKLREIAPNHYRTSVLDAMLQVESGNFEAAYAMATRVLAAVPDHIPMQLIAIKVELDRNELSSAETRLRKVLEQSPQLVDALRMRYQLELRQGQTQQARKTIDRALLIAPKDRSLLAAAADLAWARGDRATAIRQITMAAQMQPPQAQLLARLAAMKDAMGASGEAMIAIDEAIAQSAKEPRSREAVLRTVMQMHLLDKARAMVQRDIALRPKDPEPLMWMAGVLGSQGNAAGAYEQISLSLDARADYYPALFALSKMTQSPEHAKAYDERLQMAIRAGGKDARIYLDQVRRLQLTGASADQVGAVFDRGLKADPTSTELREKAVRHWLAHGRKDKALTLATEGEAVQPDNVTLIALAASTNQTMGNHEMAVKKYGQLAARMPDRIDWTLTYARSLVLAGRSSEALSVLGKLVAARPDEPASYRALALLQMDQKKKDDALLTARMLSERPKLRVPGLLLMGDIFGRAGNKKEALEAYADAGKAGAGDVAMLRKIELLDRLSLQTAASGELRQWLASSPNNIAALTLAAQREYATENYASASQFLEKIVGIQPRNPTALNDLAWAYAQSRNPAALATAKKAIALQPQNPQILDTLAEAQALAGQRADAIATLRTALQLAPDLSSVRVHLAQLLSANGDKKESEALLLNLDEHSLDKNGAARLRSERQLAAH